MWAEMAVADWKQFSLVNRDFASLNSHSICK